MSSGPELQRRRDEAQSAKNVHLGLAMMKAFGQKQDPSLSLAQQMAGIGGSFAEHVEPSMEQYRQEIKQIDQLPLEAAGQIASWETDKYGAGEGIATRQIERRGQDIEFMGTNAGHALQAMDIHLRGQMSEKDLKLKKQELIATVQIARSEVAADLIEMDLTHKAAMAETQQKGLEHNLKLAKHVDMESAVYKNLDTAIARAL